MKDQHDKKRRLVEFAIGDWVWLRLHHRQLLALLRHTLPNCHQSSTDPIKSSNALGLQHTDSTYQPRQEYTMCFMWDS